MCHYFQITRAAYYKSLKEKEKDVMAECMIVEMVLRERHLQPRLGGRKLYFMLGSSIGSIVPHFGRDKFFTLLREQGLLVGRKKQYRKTTNSWHHFHTYSNLIKDLPLTRPNQVWASDITYIDTEEGFVYLSLLTDMYSHKIVGWALSKSLSIEGCIEALKSALCGNRTTQSLIHHSDRGIQYCSKEYVNVLNKNNISISMTEENHCYENAMAERVNGILKDEYLLDGRFKNFTLAKQSCAEAIKLYNTRRPHMALKYRTPQEVHHVA